MMCFNDFGNKSQNINGCEENNIVLYIIATNDYPT